MKNMKKLCAIAIACMMVMCAFFLQGCKKDDNSETPDPDDVTVELSKGTLVLNVYEDFTLIAQTNGDAVVFWSSSDTSVATVDGGRVLALKAGTARITASAGGSSAYCDLTVTESGIIPLLSFGLVENSLSLFRSARYPLKPRLEYNNLIYTDATYTYAAANDVITVSESGVVTAQKVGVSLVTVAADWRGNTAPTLRAEIPVVVRSDANVVVDESSVEIYVSAPRPEFQTTATVSAAVYILSGEVPSATVEWTEEPRAGDTTGAATISNGVITAVRAGRTTFYASYTADGVTVKSAPLEVSVLLPRIVSASARTYLDKSDGAIEMSFDELTETDRIVSAYDQTNGKQIGVDDSAKLAAGDLSLGDAELEVNVDDEIIYLVSVRTVTKLIKEAQDLTEMFTLGGAGAEPGYSYGGYFVLARNIDATGITVTTPSYWRGWYSDDFPEYGFNGIFDGCGYTVSNLTVSERGLFGTIGRDAIVKNVAFSNMRNGGGGYGVPMAYSVYGGTFENVFVSFAPNQAFYAPFMHVQNGSVFKNVVFYTPGVGGKTFSNMVGKPTAVDFEAEVSAFLIISDTEKPFADTHQNISGLRAQIKVFDVDDYQTDADFLEQNFTIAFDCTTNGLWAISNALRIPVFKSSRL